ncbi:MAG TPA: hypothetical protein VFA85_02430 [Terriglobales bacterium]|nr:hypothetical protein [Terriglobales bacterium]
MAVITLPGVVHGNHILKRVFLLLACLALVSGWFFLLKDREPNSLWRASITLLTSVYLTASLPVFFFELSQMRWLMRDSMHRVFSAYAWLWVHWGSHGFLQVFLGVVGSFFGRGRARIAFLTGSVLLMILWAAMGTWGY